MTTQNEEKMNLEFAQLLATFHEQIWAAATDENSSIAFDLAGRETAKKIIEKMSLSIACQCDCTEECHADGKANCYCSSDQMMRYVRRLEAQLSESQKREAALQAEMDELKRKLEAQQAFIATCIENPESGDQFFNSELRDGLRQVEELTKLIATERAAERNKVLAEMKRKLAEQEALLMEVAVAGEECEFDDVTQYVMPIETHQAVSDYAFEQTDSCKELTNLLSAERQKVLAEMSQITHVIVRNVDITTGTKDSVCKLQTPLYALPEAPQPAAQKGVEDNGK